MRRLTIMLLISVAALSTRLSAQQPMGEPMPGPRTPTLGAPGAEMLLSRTGALQLTDQQVVRLAAIARRAEDRRRLLRTRLDSLRPRFAPGDTAARRERRNAAPTDVFEHEREAAHNDLRDALSVLTAEQQARVFETVAAQRAMPMPSGPFGGMMQRGPGGAGGGNAPGDRRDRQQPLRRPPGTEQ